MRQLPRPRVVEKEKRGVIERGIRRIPGKTATKPTKKEDTQVIFIFGFDHHIETQLALHISLYYNVLYWQGWRVLWWYFLVAHLKTADSRLCYP